MYCDKAWSMNGLWDHSYQCRCPAVTLSVHFFSVNPTNPTLRLCTLSSFVFRQTDHRSSHPLHWITDSCTSSSVAASTHSSPCSQEAAWLFWTAFHLFFCECYESCVIRCTLSMFGVFNKYIITHAPSIESLMRAILWLLLLPLILPLVHERIVHLIGSNEAKQAGMGTVNYAFASVNW